ncbi:MAG: hypothetical protein J6B34_03945 [Clostridia bacterium]|nr:hypothetical protein [Clostridia bacterium]
MEKTCIRINLDGKTIKEYLSRKKEIMFEKKDKMNFIDMDLENKYKEIKDDKKYKVILQRCHSTIYKLNSNSVIYSINHTND